jgi:hypothetical protein
MKTQTTLLGSTLLAAALVFGTTAPGLTEQVPQTNTSTGTKKVEDIDQYKQGSGAPKSMGADRQMAPKAATTGSGAANKQMNTTSGTNKVDDPDQNKGSGAMNSNAAKRGQIK